MIAVRNPITGREQWNGSAIRLDNGDTVRLEDVRSWAQGRALLAEVDLVIGRIQQQLDDDLTRPDDPGWHIRAQRALRLHQRGREVLVQRIGRLKVSERSENKRVAFINAAEDMLDAELFTEIWARAEERNPEAFAKSEAGHA